MKFSVDRESLLRPMQQVSGVVERRQALPILQNLLLEIQDGKLLITGTDLEIELRNSLDTNEMKSGFRRSFFVLPVTISVIFESAVGISVIKLSYASGESTGTAFGPISVPPLALLIQCGSKNGNSG